MSTTDAVRYGTKEPFKQYDNYKAIEVPFVKYIPNDYPGVMAVPISFLDKYNPRQFEIIGQMESSDTSNATEALRTDPIHRDAGYLNGKRMYSRLLIRHRRKK